MGKGDSGRQREEREDGVLQRKSHECQGYTYYFSEFVTGKKT